MDENDNQDDIQGVAGDITGGGGIQCYDRTIQSRRTVLSVWSMSSSSSAPPTMIVDDHVIMIPSYPPPSIASLTTALSE